MDPIGVAYDSLEVRACARRWAAILRRNGVSDDMSSADDLRNEAYVRIRGRLGATGDDAVRSPIGLLCTAIANVARDRLRRHRARRTGLTDPTGSELAVRHHERGYEEAERGWRAEQLNGLFGAHGDRLWSATVELLGPREPARSIRTAARRAAVELAVTDHDPTRGVNEILDDVLRLVLDEATSPDPGANRNSRARSRARLRPWVSHLVWQSLRETTEQRDTDLLLLAVTAAHRADVRRRVDALAHPGQALREHLAGLDSWLARFGLSGCRPRR